MPSIGELVAELSINPKGLDRAAVEARKSASKMERSFDEATTSVERRVKTMSRRIGSTLQSTGRRMQSFGQSFSTFVSLPAAAAFGAASKAAIDFESAFAGVRKTVDASEAEFDRLSKGFRRMSKEIPTSANELAGLGEIAGQLGVETKNILAFSRTIADLGETTDIAGEEAALSLSRFMNVMGTAQGDIDRLGSTIVDLGNNFAARESEIVDLGRNLASFGAQINLSESQVLAFATTIAASGGEAAAASTAFQKVALTMKDAVITGNNDLQKFANVAGVSAEKFRAAFEDDAAQALQLFLQGLRRVDEQGGSTTQILDDLGLADQRLVREFGKVIGNLDQLEQALGVANTAWEENTALAKEAAQRYKTTAAQLSILWNRVKDLGVVFGNDLLPVIRSATQTLGRLTEWLSELNPSTRRLLLTMTGLAAVIGPFALAAGTLATILGGALLGSIGLVTIALAGIATGVITIIEHWDFLKSETKRIWNSIVSFIQGALDSFVGAIESAINGVISGLNWLGNQMARIPGITHDNIEQFKFLKNESNNLAASLGGVNEEAGSTALSFNKLKKAGEDTEKQQKKWVDSTYDDFLKRTGQTRESIALASLAVEDWSDTLDKAGKQADKTSKANGKLNDTFDANIDLASDSKSESELFVESLADQETALKQSVQAYKLAGDSALDYEAALQVVQARALGLGGSIEQMVRRIQELRELVEFERAFYEAFDDLEITDTTGWEIVFPDPDDEGRDRGKDFGRSLTEGMLDEVRNTIAGGFESILTFEFDSVIDVVKDFGRRIASIISQSLANAVTKGITAANGQISFSGGIGGILGNITSLFNGGAGIQAQNNIITGNTGPFGLGGFPGGGDGGLFSGGGFPSSGLGQAALFGAPFLGAGLGFAQGGVPGAIQGGLSGLGGSAGFLLGGPAGAAVGGLLGNVIGSLLGGLFEDRPRFDVEVFNIGNEREIQEALANGITRKVSDVIRLGFDDAFRNEQIFVKGKGGAEDIGEADEIRRQVSESLNNTVDKIFGIINQLPNEMATNLREIFRNTELKFDQLVDDASLEFDEGSSDIKDITKRWNQFLNADLPARFLTTIGSFFTTTVKGLGVNAEAAERFVEGRLDEIKNTESRELRGKLGEDFLKDFQAFVDAFNFVNQEMKSQFDLAISNLTGLAEELGFSGGVPSFEMIRNELKSLLEAGEITADVVDKFSELKNGLVELRFAITDAISSTVSLINNVNNSIVSLGGTATGGQQGINALNEGISSLQELVESGVLTPEQEQAALERMKSFTDQLVNIQVEAQRRAIDQRISGIRGQIDTLRELQRAEQERYRTQLDALQSQLRIVNQYANLNERLEDDLRGLFTGSNSILTPIEQLNFIQGEVLRAQQTLNNATTDQGRLNAIDNLRGLSSELIDLGGRAFSAGSPEFQALFRQTADRLQGLLDITGDEAEKQDTLNEQIAHVEQQLDAIPERFDARIEALQSTISNLQNQANQLSGQAAAEARAYYSFIRERAMGLLESQLGSLHTVTSTEVTVLRQIRDLLSDAVKGGGTAPLSGGVPVNQSPGGDVFGWQSLSGFGGGGIGNFGRGTPVMLHGTEGIFTEEQMKALGGGGERTLNLNIKLDGDASVETKKYFVGELKKEIIEWIRFEEGRDYIKEASN